MISALARATAKWNVFYADFVYRPLSRVGRELRPIGRTLRGLPREITPTGTLPEISWRDVLPALPIRVVEMRKAHGNVRADELAILARAARSVGENAEIIEIGTFDGRTTLNLAINSAATTRVFTLDLPANSPTAFTPMPTERAFIDKPAPGERFRNYGGPWRESCTRITQYTGDSATFDWSSHHAKAGLVFVDGSHAYEYAVRDSETAFQLVRENGIIIWHDYGVWKGITQALDEIEAARQLGMRRFRGTSLVFWRATK